MNGVEHERRGTTARTRTVLAAGLAIAAIAAALVWGRASPGEPTPPASLPVLPVQVAAVLPEEGQEPAEGSALASTAAAAGGWFAAVLHHDREARLGFRVPGRLSSLPVRIGDRLPAGALLAQLDPALYAAAAERAAADYARVSRTAERTSGLAREGAAAAAQASDATDLSRAAAAGLAASRTDLRDTRLTMPFAGTVIERAAEQGEVVSPGQPVLTVADTASPLLARAQVPAAVAVGLQQGQSGQVRLADGQLRSARVLRVAGAADSRTGLVTVELALASGAGAISGAPASVQLAAASETAATPGRSRVLRIPAEALLEAQGHRASVYVIDLKGRARRRPVELLGLVDRDARIMGLPVGVRVITLGAGFVRDGQRVEVTR
ncbi:efflux RND transporter periplasmic adaptor subunit [Novosphingobium piscinae]|uniref:Efflux RND transporter periplasmic adaptor subunit n=1 Tax=Novosphingobium piscinae TaxID=1507448 RepID=A0A7X1FXM3_9SPHN|nr:efflux RND transporter periplasmic adaptor subunit [Novosphingobium piscinae]MBC2668875.1 efflux RND transporter periplasmic adaptor subunit [Novosphingobium piscinae]